jgi:hypothetical protein
MPIRVFGVIRQLKRPPNTRPSVAPGALRMPWPGRSAAFPSPCIDRVLMCIDHVLILCPGVHECGHASTKRCGAIGRSQAAHWMRPLSGQTLETLAANPWSPKRTMAVPLGPQQIASRTGDSRRNVWDMGDAEMRSCQARRLCGLDLRGRGSPAFYEFLNLRNRRKTGPHVHGFVHGIPAQAWPNGVS